MVMAEQGFIKVKQIGTGVISGKAQDIVDLIAEKRISEIIAEF